MTIAYLAHPLGDADADWSNRRSDNLANAIDWFTFLRRVTRWAICYPALAYIAADSEIQRPSALVGQVEIALACHVLVLTGGRLSPHMGIELRRAEAKPMAVLDLLHLGRLPPWDDRDQLVLEIGRRAQELGL